MHLIVNVNFKTGIVNQLIISKFLKIPVFLILEQIKTRILNKSQNHKSFYFSVIPQIPILFQSQICTCNPNIPYFLKNVHFSKFLTNTHQTHYPNISVSLPNQLGIFKLLKTSTIFSFWNKFPKSRSSLSSSSVIVPY